MPQEAQFGIIWSQTRPQGLNPFFQIWGGPGIDWSRDVRGVTWACFQSPRYPTAGLVVRIDVMDKRPGC